MNDWDYYPFIFVVNPRWERRMDSDPVRRPNGGKSNYATTRELRCSQGNEGVEFSIIRMFHRMKARGLSVVWCVILEGDKTKTYRELQVSASLCGL